MFHYGLHPSGCGSFNYSFMLRVKIKNLSKNQLPAYETDLSAGMDLRANLASSIVLFPKQRLLIPTGISIELPAGYEAQVRSRSGLASKHGIVVLNSPGTVDADYRGEIRVLLCNLGHNPVNIVNTMRIAQFVVSPCEHVEWEEVDELSDTQRGDGSFGSTGII